VSGEACAVHSGGDKCWTYATAVHSRGVYFKNHFLYFDTHSSDVRCCSGQVFRAFMFTVNFAGILAPFQEIAHPLPTTYYAADFSHELPPMTNIKCQHRFKLILRFDERRLTEEVYPCPLMHCYLWS